MTLHFFANFLVALLVPGCHYWPKTNKNNEKMAKNGGPYTLTCLIIVQQTFFFFEKNPHLISNYMTLIGRIRVLISEIFLSKPDFHLHKWEKNSSYTTLLRPKRLSISEKSTTYTIKWSYTIIWQVRVLEFWMWWLVKTLVEQSNDCSSPISNDIFFSFLLCLFIFPLPNAGFPFG